MKLLTLSGVVFYNEFVCSFWIKKAHLERTQAGLKAARARSRKGGRPTKPVNFFLLAKFLILYIFKPNNNFQLSVIGVLEVVLLPYITLSIYQLKVKYQWREKC